MPLKCCSRLGPKDRVVPMRTLTSTTTTFMSRRARHFAADTKASARRQDDLLYSQSLPYAPSIFWCILIAIVSILLHSGKVVCPISRLLKQCRKVEQIPPTSSLNHICGHPRLSPKLFALNKLLLPVSILSFSPGSMHHISPDRCPTLTATTTRLPSATTQAGSASRILWDRVFTAQCPAHWAGISLCQWLLHLVFAGAEVPIKPKLMQARPCGMHPPLGKKHEAATTSTSDPTSFLPLPLALLVFATPSGLPDNPPLSTSAGGIPGKLMMVLAQLPSGALARAAALQRHQPPPQ